ncbi:MAG TPA: hypothetical protein VGJ14_04330 [Sporichthyaceae bacterium]
MLLVIALLLILLFGGLGFAVHVLWWGLIIGLILAIVHTVQRGNRAGTPR